MDAEDGVKLLLSSSQKKKKEREEVDRLAAAAEMRGDGKVGVNGLLLMAAAWKAIWISQ